MIDIESLADGFEDILDDVLPDWEENPSVNIEEAETGSIYYYLPSPLPCVRISDHSSGGIDVRHPDEYWIEIVGKKSLAKAKNIFVKHGR